jgi:hypothetical protein
MGWFATGDPLGISKRPIRAPRVEVIDVIGKIASNYLVIYYTSTCGLFCQCLWSAEERENGVSTSPTDEGSAKNI